MCLGIPGKIIEIVDVDRAIAKAEVGGVRRNVSIQLLDDHTSPVQVGDWVLIHVGFALCKIDEQEAAATLTLLNGMDSAYSDELRALEKSEIT
ncbi:MAG: hydrogenase assembly chaperone HypC/HupF [Candidatus Binatus sp.]|jgi:hydrogenase expression/formation protein HypC|nr:hydrogenase assembly chaperone HypC/HupF [Candidatus Binatus sp.]